MENKLYKTSIFSDPSGKDPNTFQITTRLNEASVMETVVVEHNRKILHLHYASLAQAAGGHYAMLEITRASMKDGDVKYKETTIEGDLNVT